MRKSLAVSACIILMTAILAVPPATIQPSVAYADEEAPDSVKLEDLVSFRKDGYDHYLNEHKNNNRPDDRIVVEAESYTDAAGMAADVLQGYAGDGATVVHTDEEGTISWEVEVKQAGLYNIGLRYFPVEGKSSAIERSLTINGATPFEGARTLTFPRVWNSANPVIKRDNRDNDLRPVQEEQPIWMEAVFKDHQGYYSEPYLFYFPQGRHTISLTSSREPMIIDYLVLYQADEVPAYSEVFQYYEEQGYRQAQDVWIKIQAEDAVRKSDPTLYPLNNRTSPSVEPYDVSKIRMNTIGGYNWRLPSQWIAWEVEAPEDGLYRIAVKYKQNMLRGIDSTRTLYIDGKVPFKEARQLTFGYDNLFQIKELGDGDEPYLFYLTKGKHEIKLEVTLGRLAPLLRQVESSVLELNYIYRKILMVTGPVPDPYRDYNLHTQIPDMTEVFRRQSEILTEVAAELKSYTGESSDRVAILNTMAYQLADLAAYPDSVPRRLDVYKVNVGALGTWILQTIEQPLELDYLIVHSDDRKPGKAEAGWFRRALHEISAFFHSFFEDYDSIGNVTDGKETVEVWIGTGRDQAQVLKTMIDDMFTPESDIQVNLKLVDMSILMAATLNGKGPDVAMQIAGDLPVNYASRNAVYDLTKFPDYGEVATRFKESAIEPYRFQDGVYALPEQQLFSMLFYRKDILDELGLEVPQTWDDVYEMIPVLQKHYLEFGLPLAQPVNGQIVVNLEANPTFAMLLYQSDGKFYTDDHQASMLDDEISQRAFATWTEFYTNYKFPLAFDFPNRFRTGEMPIGIADYTLYNHLSVSAPEIKGLWDFVPVPGTATESGELRREAASGGTNVILLQNSDRKEASWEFMKWWTSKDVQVRFGREMEGLMGAAARYPTANIEALEQLPWPVKDYRNLQLQWEWVRAIPEVPGGYFTGRHLDNAFREVVTNGMNSREALFDYTRYINKEITLKRKEFGLPARGDNR